jgi:hypothetical protein
VRMRVVVSRERKLRGMGLKRFVGWREDSTSPHDVALA